MKNSDTTARVPSFRSTRSADGKSDSVLRLADAVPHADPVGSILSEIIGVVPATRWLFARVESNGELGKLYGSPSSERARDLLADEFKRQRGRTPSGPRIAATLGSLDGLATGITLMFADTRSTFGILMLLRCGERGPFTSSEITVLTFAVGVVSDRLSALRLQPGCDLTDHASRDVSRRLPDGAFYVLDSDLRIVLGWTPDDERRIGSITTQPEERLPAALEATVRDLTAGWSHASPPPRSASRPVSFLVIRTHPMSGPAGWYIGVRIDQFEPPNSLTRAASQFHISPREVQVLALLLDGKHLNEIASQLSITPSTVQDHIKSMLEKTGSCNRSELIARVLGWESAPRDGLAS